MVAMHRLMIAHGIHITYYINQIECIERSFFVCMDYTKESNPLQILIVSTRGDTCVESAIEHNTT